VTRGDNDETRTQAAGDAGFSRMGGIAGEGNLDDEEKFNDAVKFELEKERKEAKDRMREFQKRKAAEEELLKKKKGGYWRLTLSGVMVETGLIRRIKDFYNQIKLC